MKALRGTDDQGVTLVELLVSITLLGTVSSLVLAGMISANRAVRNNSDESKGLSDVRTVAERLGRDLREARSVVCDGAVADPSCITHLQLWIDANSDYKQQSSETITWQLAPIAGDPNHYSMVRVVSGGTSTVEARTIVRNVAFSYDYPPGTTAPTGTGPHTRVVSVDMTYDPLVGLGVGTKTITFSERLRNVL